MKKRKRKDERQEIKVITSQWVEENCMFLTERDKKMLELLAQFPLLNSEHLYYLTPPTSNEKAFYELKQGRKRCNERIRVLFELHCVNKWVPRLPIGEGTSKQYVAIDRAGCKLLGIEKKTRQSIPQNWKHQSMAMDLYCQYVIHHREGKKYVYALEREYKCQTSNLIPDLSVLYKQGGKGYFFFIEIDRCEKKESAEKIKLKTYQNWRTSQAWLAEPWNKILPQPAFPLIVYLFDERKKEWKRRAKALERYAQQIQLPARFVGFQTFLNNLAES